jgi:sigma-E factor negative regulatory protein RseC
MSGQQEGVVLSTQDGMAKVKASRHNDCENCGSCPGNAAIVLDVVDPLGVKPGQRVLIAIQETDMLKSAFIVYMLPLIAIFAGAVLGGYLAGLLALDALWFQVGGGGIAFVVAVFYIKYFDRSTRENVKKQPVIIRVLSN